jgi:hypothetical protein
MEHFVLFMQYYFRGIKFKDMDPVSSELLRSLWRVNFVNMNYEFFQSKINSKKEKNQHWMVYLLTILQKAYYELTKIFYSYNEDYDDMWQRWDLFFEKIEKKKKVFKKIINPTRKFFDFRKISDLKKNTCVRGLIECSSNLLSHKYFEGHPRRFVVQYIKTLELLLALKSKRIFEFTSDWVEKNIESLSLCQSMPSIFRVIVLHRATYQLRKTDCEASILNLMDFLSAQNDLSRDDYNAAVDVN